MTELGGRKKTDLAAQHALTLTLSRKERGLTRAACAAILALAALGCEKVQPAKPADGKPAAVHVRLFLNWYPEAEHGGYYAALVHGFYRDAGLDVEIVKGGPSAPVVPQVDGGQMEFGISTADGLLLARADTYVWLDLPRLTIMLRVIRRSVNRAVTRRELWNGNRENFRNWLDPEHPIRWAWSQHAARRSRIEGLLRDHPQLTVIRLLSARAAREWSQRLEPEAPPEPRQPRLS